MPPKIFESEYRFCQILWEREPVRSGELVALCREKLGWKPTTTYTVIRRLAERGVLKNEHSVVTSLVSRTEAECAEIDELLEKRFGGSLPGFIAAFARRKGVTAAELEEAERMIEEYRKGLGDG
ncbi:MAG TPA: BlaI/MecI/CopY family transcriptional regulator [Candidatus Scatomorpha stercorigallinarum]|nr:BlaI/MecI/CopY family transcriptional regulator [Candidatus Scatomorpha stercorigallinarum]